MATRESARKSAAGRRREPAVPFQPVVDPAGWRAEDLSASGEHLFHLAPGDLREIDAAIRRIEADGIPMMEIKARHFRLPSLGGKLAGIRDEILDGRGFVQMRGFEPERYTPLQRAIAFWGVSMHLGERVASQNAKGHVLGHITDIGETVNNPNQRGP